MEIKRFFFSFDVGAFGTLVLMYQARISSSPLKPALKIHTLFPHLPQLTTTPDFKS